MSNSDFSPWVHLDGQGVVVQLTRPWVGVTHPNEPTLQRDQEGKIVGALSVLFLRGILHVTPEHMEIETADPDDRKSARVFVTLTPDMVEFVSRTEQQLIQTR